MDSVWGRRKAIARKSSSPESVLLTAANAFVTFATAVASRLAADDIKAWLPTVTESLIERAVERLPSQYRERFAEEWRSHVNETPGDIGKLVAAVGFIIAAKSVAKSQSSAEKLMVPVSKRIYAALMLFSLIPILLSTALLVFVKSGRPIFVQRKQIIGGKETAYWKFRNPYRRNQGDASENTSLTILEKFFIAETPALFSIMQGTTSFDVLIPPGHTAGSILIIGVCEFFSTLKNAVVKVIRCRK